jgi:ABC-2 type transport system permease protein
VSLSRNYSSRLLPVKRLGCNGMRLFISLLQNECTKLLRRRRPQLILAILTVFLAIATWAQYQKSEIQKRESATAHGDWRTEAHDRLDRLEQRANRRRIFTGFSRFLRMESVRLRYHLEHNIDPNQMTGPAMARAFALVASALLLPLLITVLASDLVTGENSAGTIKMLLTRPVARWKILGSKVAAMLVFATVLVGAAAMLSWMIGGVAFGWAGWTAPVFTGFRAGPGGVDLTHVRMAALWLDTLACYGLVWYATVTVGMMAVAFSVFFRSSVGAMGSLMAVLVAGSLMGQMVEDWPPAKWSFPTNLALGQFYSGVPPPVTGMTLVHSILVLGVWAAGVLGVAFVVFSRRDVTA